MQSEPIRERISCVLSNDKVSCGFELFPETHPVYRIHYWSSRISRRRTEGTISFFNGFIVAIYCYYFFVVERLIYQMHYRKIQSNQRSEVTQSVGNACFFYVGFSSV